MKKTRTSCNFNGICFAVIVATLSFSAVGIAQKPFEILVVGDSHIAGQGLKNDNKFYNLVTDWIQRELFDDSRKVNLKVKSHAGSRIKLHADELQSMQEAGDDINKFHYGEANISSPDITTQLDVARREYEKPESVNLIMLSGCITDVLVADIINPFYPERKLRERIRRFCGGSMADLLEHATASFPNAQIAVIGYFPVASSNSNVKTMARYFLKIISFPRKLQFFFTNPLSRQFLKILRNKIAKRSRIWLEESNREIIDAIAKLNAERDRPRAFFVASPIGEEFSYATKNALLWEIDKNHIPNDETYAERLAGCAKVFGEMKYQHYGRLSRRMCELSSVAHPNVEGSRAFADAIKIALRANVFNQDENKGNLRDF